MPAVSCGFSHVSAVNTSLRWIFIKALYKAIILNRRNYCLVRDLRVFKLHFGVKYCELIHVELSYFSSLMQWMPLTTSVVHIKNVRYVLTKAINVRIFSLVILF